MVLGDRPAPCPAVHVSQGRVCRQLWQAAALLVIEAVLEFAFLLPNEEPGMLLRRARQELDACR